MLICILPRISWLSGAGHGGVHVAGAGEGERTGSAQRPVLVWSGAVRDGYGNIAVPGRHVGSDFSRDPRAGSYVSDSSESRCSRRTGADHQPGTGEGPRTTVPTCVGDAGRAAAAETGYRFGEEDRGRRAAGG